MALLRCTKCSHLREVGNDYIGKSVKCPKCSNVSKIYDTVSFVSALVQKHILQKEELYALRKKLAVDDQAEIPIMDTHSLSEIDIYNTKVLTEAENFEPILQWFSDRKILLQINGDAVDTTGFFDEIAVSIGSNYSVLKFIVEQIKYIQKKGYETVKLDLTHKNPNEILQIVSFCKQMYEYSFVSRFVHNKKEQAIYLNVQTAPKIRSFFDGIWMEWFIFMRILELFRMKNIPVSCLKNINVEFNNGAVSEIDIFLVTKTNIPICIECKSGEFRQDIDRYLKLRKQLNLNKNQFLLCIFGLSDEHTAGMTSMYDLTFVNEVSVFAHIESIIS